jgi:hypothetical protein
MATNTLEIELFMGPSERPSHLIRKHGVTGVTGVTSVTATFRTQPSASCPTEPLIPDLGVTYVTAVTPGLREHVTPGRFRSQAR